MEKLLHVGIHVEHYAVDPCLASIGNLSAIDIELEHIVVAVLDVEVFVKVALVEIHVSADVDICALASPATADVVAFSAPSGFLCPPGSIVEVWLCPAFAVLPIVSDFAFPRLFVRHRGNGSEDVFLLCAHETIGCAVHAKQSEDGLLVVRPVASRAVGELVVRAPDGEVRVIDNQRYRGQTQVCCRVGFEEVACLGANSGSYCHKRGEE